MTDITQTNEIIEGEIIQVSPFTLRDWQPVESATHGLTNWLYAHSQISAGATPEDWQTCYKMAQRIIADWNKGNSDLLP